MNPSEITHSNYLGRALRKGAVVLSLLLLPPFIALAFAPLLLLLPVAMIGIPFIVPALFRGSLAVHRDERRRSSLRPVLRAVPVLR